VDRAARSARALCLEHFTDHGGAVVYEARPFEVLRLSIGHCAASRVVRSRVVLSAAIELVGGVLVTLGLFTRAAALIMSGEMAIGYFMIHAPASFYPYLNHGELAIMYCFVFLYIFFVGPGPWSLDALIWRRK
jgi:uncharacterized membrane protein YphA (DoxX/SURF4 family)